MTQEDKILLLKDLSARLTCRTMVKCNTDGHHEFDEELSVMHIMNFYQFETKPYLRPMSSMTEEEKIKLYQIAGFYYLSNNELLKDEWRQFSDALSENELFLPYPIWGNDLQRVYDWFNENHFDYRGLIERGLALEALDGMYGLKEK